MKFILSNKSKPENLCYTGVRGLGETTEGAPDSYLSFSWLSKPKTYTVSLKASAGALPQLTEGVATWENKVT